MFRLLNAFFKSLFKPVAFYAAPIFYTVARAQRDRIFSDKPGHEGRPRQPPDSYG